jgi:hypothetical protein
MAKLELTEGTGITLQEVTDTDNKKLIISSYFGVYMCVDTTVVPQNIEDYNMIAIVEQYNMTRGGGANYTYYILTKAGSESSQTSGSSVITKSRTYTNIIGSGTITATKVGDADWTWTIST